MTKRLLRRALIVFLLKQNIFKICRLSQFPQFLHRLCIASWKSFVNIKDYGPNLVLEKPVDSANLEKKNIKTYINRRQNFYPHKPIYNGYIPFC